MATERRARLRGGTIVWIAVLAVVGCAADAPPAGEWMLTSINGGSVLADGSVSMRSDSGAIRGIDGCNSFSATMKGTADQGRISGFSTTLRACADRDLQDQADRVAAILAGSPGYEARDEALIVSNGAGELRFRRVS